MRLGVTLSFIYWSASPVRKDGIKPKVWRWLTAPRKPKWSDVFLQFGYIALVWEIASFVQNHWFGRTYSEIPYRIFFIGFALGTPVLLKINIGALRWLSGKIEFP
jgi:hypothetical protein